MLDALKKMVGAAPEAAVEQVDALATLQADFDSYKTSAEELAALLTAEATEAKEKLAAALAEVETLKTALAEVEAAKAAAAAEAAAAKVAARKEKLVAAVGDVRADALMLATEEMDDMAFEAVVSALNMNVAVEAKTEMFGEVGVAAEADAAKVVGESTEMKILRAKYGM